MDLLVLADSTGAVDMTLEAISRRTNVPQAEVEKYINDLCQPDARSRSDLHEGKRLIPLDERRDWGWLIVNYQHYRQIKDEEARRTYFRNAQRLYRKGKKKVVKDKGLTEFNNNGQSLTPSSASSSVSFWEELKRNPLYEGVEVDKELEKAKQWCRRKGRKLTKRFFENWLGKADRVLMDVPPSKPRYLPPPNQPTDEEFETSKRIAKEAASKLREQFRMPT